MRAKISGITDMFAAITAEECGADFISFNFDLDNKDFVTPERAMALAQQIPRTRKVGVFTDDDIDRVKKIATMVGLDYVQLNGDESNEYIRQMPCPVIKRYYYNELFSVEKAENSAAEMILLDIGEQNYKNGNLARDIATLHKSVILAANVDRENALKINKDFHPYALEVSEGLKDSGTMTPRKIRAFFRRLGKIMA